MSFFDAMILGIIQGLTEFLPVSSSGHLVILENLLNIRTDTDVLFHVLLHFGTLIAICLVFKNDLFRMLVETIHIFQDLTANFKIYIDNKMHSAQTTPYRKILCNNYRTMVAMILISTIPTGILGYLLQNLVDRWSSSLPVTGLGLLITAVLLLVVDNWQLGNKLPKHITVPQALAIGVCQGISVIPGISRSGITITAGFLCGFRRGFAIRYSYLVSIPAILGAMVSWIQLYSRYAHRSCRRIFFHSIYAGFYKEEKTSHFFHLLFYHGDSCDRLLFYVEHIR